jgi:hypothetical protein
MKPIRAIGWAAIVTFTCSVALPRHASAEPASFDASHAAWTALLHGRVMDGLVDYAGLRRHDLPKLDAYLASLGTVTRADYVAWGREAQLAYWINAYNAFTVKLIVDRYPLKSIRSIGLLPGAAFREKFIPLPGLRAKRYSLDEIENDVLRKEFREPRIHFAIVCASTSCPALRSEAYRASDLEVQLDDAARSFLGDPSRNRVDGETLHLSSIFKWFAGDFEAAAGSVEAFVRPYLGLEANRSYRIESLPYDWSLNERKETP